MCTWNSVWYICDLWSHNLFWENLLKSALLYFNAPTLPCTGNIVVLYHHISRMFKGNDNPFHGTLCGSVHHKGQTHTFSTSPLDQSGHQIHTCVLLNTLIPSAFKCHQPNLYKKHLLMTELLYYSIWCVLNAAPQNMASLINHMKARS